MLNNEEFNTIVDQLREKLPEENRALISDELTTIMANQTSGSSRINELEAEVKKLNEKNEELLLTNGKLFQKLGTPLTEKIEDEIIPQEKEEKLIDIKDVINEKGDIL